jgi:hypothetical protein
MYLLPVPPPAINTLTQDASSAQAAQLRRHLCKVLPLATARWPIAGNIETGTFAIFALGYNCCSGALTTRNKYTYSGCVVSAGGAATVASRLSSAAGNSTVGIFALGLGAPTTRNKYTYSGCVVAAGGAATVASYSGSAASNGTTGVNM